MPGTLPSLVLEQAAARPGATALRKKDFGIWQETTWAGYRDEVAAVALALADFGLRPGDRALIIADNEPAWLYADLGIQSCGAYSIGAYPTQVAAEVAYILEHSAARIAFCGDQEQVDKVVEHRSRLPALERIVAFDMKGVTGYGDPMIEAYSAFTARGAALAATDPERFPAMIAVRDGEEVAVVGYTSGTTGKPKGAMLRHRNQVAMARALVNRAGIGPRDRILSHFPLCHPAVRVMDAYTSLVCGCSVNFPESVETVLDDMVELSPTMVLGTPRVFELMMAEIEIRAARADRFKRWVYERAWTLLTGRLERRLAGRRHPLDPVAGLAGHWLGGRQVLDHLGLRELRFASCGGASTSPELLKFFWSLGVPLFETYGQSETSGVAFAQRDYSDVGTAGVPLEGVEARISPEGELLLRGPGIFAGYLGDAARTREAFDGDWYHTGDVARLDEQGRLVMMDREKHVMRMADGRELSPSEIENKLKLSPYISDVMVIGPGRPFVTALIQIELQTVSDWALRQKLPFTTFRSLADNPKVVQLVEGEVAKANSLLPEDRRVHGFRLLPRQLDPDDDEITPTRKIKREVVVRRFDDLIESMYEAVAEPT